jgi:ParB/RepB/Spo0J family partition protein
MPELVEVDAVFQIALEDISRSEDQPRTLFENDSIARLAASMEADGQINPVLVAELGNGKYRLLAGERRFRAAGVNGWKTIRATVQRAPLNDDARLLLQLAENVHRQDLTPLDEARAYLRLTDRGWTAERLAERIGQSARYVWQRLQFLQLGEEAQAALNNRSILPGHAEVLCRLTPERQAEALEECASRDLTVRGLRAFVDVAYREKAQTSAVQKMDEAPATSVYQADLGFTDPQKYRRTPAGQKTVKEILTPGTPFKTNYSGPYRVREVVESCHLTNDGEKYPNFTIVCDPLIPPKKKAKEPAGWINELVAIDGRILKLFENNLDEIFILTEEEAAKLGAESQAKAAEQLENDAKPVERKAELPSGPVADRDQINNAKTTELGKFDLGVRRRIFWKIVKHSQSNYSSCVGLLLKDFLRNELTNLQDTMKESCAELLNAFGVTSINDFLDRRSFTDHVIAVFSIELVHGVFMPLPISYARLLYAAQDVCKLDVKKIEQEEKAAIAGMTLAESKAPAKKSNALVRAARAKKAPKPSEVSKVMKAEKAKLAKRAGKAKGKGKKK